MRITERGVDERQLFWLVVIDLTLVTSGLVMALADRLTPREEVPLPAPRKAG